MGADPLIDTLFRPTAVPLQDASAPPVRVTGTRSRAGNAMERTRAALLAGARRAVEASGTKITMAQVAAAAGVAKATLYNHFRTREAVLSALMADEISQLIDRARGRALPEALETAATALSDHPVLRALARREPATLSALGRVDGAAAGWRQVREAVRAAVAEADRGGAELVLRWLASHVVSPSTPDVIAADVEVLVAG
ncbi:MAG: TetR family transcriptional regulator, partial [Actinobacteria bacterium]|nr:TetR family transcriptional regulator [Actinomycetota bacterium]